jgi:hypothetical protein
MPVKGLGKKTEQGLFSRFSRDYLIFCGDQPHADQLQQIKAIINNQQARTSHSEPFTSTAQFAINGQYGVEFLLQIIAALLAFLQFELKATFFFKAMTLSLKQLAFQLNYPLEIGRCTRCCRWRLGIFDQIRWR